MKKICILLLGTLLFITSCAPNMNEDEVLQKDESEEQTSIVPSYQLSEENYKMILPYRPSEARGVIVNQVANRLDIDEVEEGLRRHSKGTFDPSKYFFEEGQYITTEMVQKWIDEFNPKVKENSKEEIYRKNPRYLSHILEQNFLQKKGKEDDKSVKLSGMSIGLAMKSVYRFQTKPGGPYYYEQISQKEMMKKANEVAKKVLQQIRKIDGLANIPIMIAIYREEDRSSPVPGNFVAKQTVTGGSASIGEWDSINEQYILFPSSEGKEKYFDDHEIVSSFGNKIAEYFPNYVGVIGEGFYVDKELQKLTLEIPIEFYGKGEIIGFTQFAYGLVKEMFADHYDLEIKVTSSDKLESLIYREAGKKSPTVHIFH